MLLKEGTRVETTSGEQVGSVARVVIDPRSKEITHIVIEKGFLFVTDRVLPASLITESDDQRLVVNLDTEDLDQYPEFEVTRFVTLDEKDLPVDREALFIDEKIPLTIPYPSVGPHHYWGPSNVAATPRYIYEGYAAVKEQNIPDEAVALKKGAALISEDGKRVGELNEVLVDQQDNQATHLILSKGLFSAEKKLIPTSWITRVDEEEIQLCVSARIINKLSVYENN